MLPKPKFCPQCGAPVETQLREGEPRDICSACGTVVYQNPPPLAASVVLNERREVLLVRCKHGPDEEAWCLPMGFAAAGESLAEAARREVREQAGIETELIRLLDTDSTASEDYGNLLIVTYEMRKVGGTEAPGEKADAAAYYPLSRHPPLGFSSNEKALRLCADSHLEEWAIRDSFERLQTDGTKVMLSDVLITLIRDRAADVARLWLAEVCENPTTARYKTLDQEKLLEGATLALSQLGRWLSGREADREVTDFYVQLGHERRAQGFKAHEVLSVLMLLKKHIWTFARNHGIWERPIDVYRVLELNRRMAVFFDKAAYHATRGFEADDAPRE
jgi:ADP-ribose pyrophosphatase YjhB (NUDIX family)